MTTNGLPYGWPPFGFYLEKKIKKREKIYY